MSDTTRKLAFKYVKTKISHMLTAHMNGITSCKKSPATIDSEDQNQESKGGNSDLGTAQVAEDPPSQYSNYNYN